MPLNLRRILTPSQLAAINRIVADGETAYVVTDSHFWDTINPDDIYVVRDATINAHGSRYAEMRLIAKVRVRVPRT
jgi:hypothetical protein